MSSPAVTYRSVDLDLEMGGDNYPCTGVQVTYALDSVPKAFFTLPYGIDPEINWRTSSLSLKDMRGSVPVELDLRFGGYSAATIFTGRLTEYAAIGRGGGRPGYSIAARADGWLGALATQPSAVMRSPTLLSSDTSYWGENAAGFIRAEPIWRIAQGYHNVSGEVILALEQLCYAQNAYGVWGEALAALRRYDPISTDCRLRTDLLDQTMRYEIASAIQRVLAHEGQTVWGRLRAFCSTFGFAIVPKIESFRLVPLCTPGYDRPQFGGDHYKLYDVEEINFGARGLQPRPLRGIAMHAQSLGPWGLTEGRDVVGSWIFSDSGVGDILSIPAPGWLLPWAGYSNLADYWSRFIALREAYGNVTMGVKLPYIAGIPPGSLIELQCRRATRPLGGEILFGIARSVMLEITQQHVGTTLDLTHVMTADEFETLALREHPLTRCYWLGGGEGLSSRIDAEWGK